MLAIEAMDVVFGAGAGRYHALAGIDLTVGEGEFLCLLGPSGCGKSTLLNAMAGFIAPTGGRVVFDGRGVTGPGPERMMFFQDAGAALFPWLTVEASVDYALKIRKKPAEARREAIDRYLAMVNLSDHREKFPHEISGGMRQRLQIARGLAADPRCLLMDEPFAALDALTKRRMQGFLQEIWTETSKTIVFVTHDIAEAIRLADTIAVMSVGPRSVIRETIDLKGLARPRDAGDADFAAIHRHLEALLDAEETPA